MDVKIFIVCLLAILLLGGVIGWMLRGTRIKTVTRDNVVLVKDSVNVDSLRATIRPIARFRTITRDIPVTDTTVTGEFTRLQEQYADLLNQNAVIQSIIAEADTVVQRPEIAYHLQMSYDYGSQMFSHQMTLAGSVTRTDTTTVTVPIEPGSFWDSVLTWSTRIGIFLLGIITARLIN